jgi:hypothetical protein
MCMVILHSESLFIWVNIAAHLSAMWQSGQWYKSLQWKKNGLLVILILVLILRIFPNSHLKLRESFIHMPIS